MFDLNAARQHAYDEVWDALPSNDLIPALFATDYMVGAQEDLAQWLMEEQVCTPAQLVFAVQSGSLSTWFANFSRVWADRRAQQLMRLSQISEEMSLATDGWQ